MKKLLSAFAAGSMSCVASSAALAHVKWFAPYDAAEQPLSMAAMPLSIWPAVVLVAVAFALACGAERTRAGPAFLRLCEIATVGLRLRIEDLLRGAAAIFFAALALQGDLILTPELKTKAGWVPLVQAGIAAAMFWRSTLPLAALGIVALLAFGTATYGTFHMMDYPVFLGIAAFFALSATAEPRRLSRRLDFARYGMAFSLMWAAVEKWAYPHWTGYVLQSHPHLAMGIDRHLLIALAGAVEFGLGFGLLWTPAIRKAAAAAVAAVMSAAILEFGATDAMGHLLLVAILVAIVAEKDDRPARTPFAMRSLALAPTAQALALVAIVCGYYGSHRLAYGTQAAPAQNFAATARTVEAHALPEHATHRQ